MKHLFVYINAAIIAFAVALFGYWYFLDGNVVGVPLVDKTDTLHLKTDKKIYSPGEEIVVYNAFCKYRDLPALISMQLVDGEIVSMVTRQNNLPVGCYGVEKPFSMSIVAIPNVISHGTWRLRWSVQYQINPIKTITYYRETEEFTIVKP